MISISSSQLPKFPTGIERNVVFHSGKCGFKLSRSCEGLVIVHAIEEGSQAHQQGLQMGDIVLELDGLSLRSTVFYKEDKASWRGLVHRLRTCPRPFQISISRPSTLSQVERRCEVADGCIYTPDEFRGYYGDESAWLNNAPRESSMGGGESERLEETSLQEMSAHLLEEVTSTESNAYLLEQVAWLLQEKSEVEAVVKRRSQKKELLLRTEYPKFLDVFSSDAERIFKPARPIPNAMESASLLEVCKGEGRVDMHGEESYMIDEANEATDIPMDQSQAFTKNTNHLQCDGSPMNSERSVVADTAPRLKKSARPSLKRRSGSGGCTDPASPVAVTQRSEVVNRRRSLRVQPAQTDFYGNPYDFGELSLDEIRRSSRKKLRVQPTQTDFYGVLRDSGELSSMETQRALREKTKYSLRGDR